MLILVTIGDILAAIIRGPGTLAVHRLATASSHALSLIMDIWASIAIVQGDLSHTVHSAALVRVIIIVVMTRLIISPRSNTVRWLSALLSGALLKLVSVWASVSIVGRSKRDLVKSAPLVRVCFAIMTTRAIGVPSSDTINWLRATSQCALNIAVSVWASVATVGRGSLNNISAALLVLVSVIVMLACIILTPSSQAIHWLGAALSGALLVSVRVWASKTIVSSVHSDSIGSASPVLVICAVMITSSVRSPVSNTINRLATAIGRALDLLILKWTNLTIQVCFDCNSVGSASLVLVTISNVVAASVQAPFTNTVNRLTAFRLGAVLELILVWASKAIVGSSSANLVGSASLVLMTVNQIFTSAVIRPCSNTVHWLGTALRGALLKLISVWASITVVQGRNRDLVESASLVAVVFLFMEARGILIPSTNAVNRLLAKLGAALNIAVSVWASVSIGRRGSAHNVSPALLVLVCVIIMKTRSKLIPSSQAVHWLGAALSGALLVSIGVWASITIVGNASADGIGSASPVLVILLIVEACGVVTPLSNTVHRLAASSHITLHFFILVRALHSPQSRFCRDLVDSAALILVSRSNMLASIIGAPLALTINRLSTSALGTVFQVMSVRTSISIVQSNL